MIAPGTGLESGIAAVQQSPLVSAWVARAALIFAAYAVTLALSGVLVRFFVLPKGASAEWPPAGETPPGGWARFDPSAIIGKCENLITVTLVLTNNLAGLAVVFAAKSLVRSDAIKRDPGFYLGGTLVNLVWGLLVASLVRVLLTL